MADIPGNIQKIQIEETDFESPASEALLQNIGANINALIDGRVITVFTSSGTYNVPEQTTDVLLIGCGGGGGGAGGSAAGGFTNIPGGGGAGAPLLIKRVSVTPSAAIAVTIGSGGGGGQGLSTTSGLAGGSGGNTTFGSLFTARGAEGGYRYQIGTNNLNPDDGETIYIPDPITGTPAGERMPPGGKARGGGTYGGFGGKSSTVYLGDILGQAGQGSAEYNGGAGGGARGSGGGGAGPFGNGASGVADTTAGGTNGLVGNSAGANTGAGGSGGGGAGVGVFGGNGGNGGSGILIIYTLN